jgi:hypothetical protein
MSEPAPPVPTDPAPPVPADPAPPVPGDIERGAAPAGLPVPEAAASSPWALILLAVGAAATLVLRWRRTRP